MFSSWSNLSHVCIAGIPPAWSYVGLSASHEEAHAVDLSC